jgi:uncharacterized membrane protein
VSTSTTFIAVVFPSAAAAEGAIRELRERDVPVRDAAVVVRTEAGRIELQQSHELAAGEAFVGGGSVGLVAGLLFGFPLGGALLGLAAGLAYGIRDRGLPDSRMRKLGEDLKPGQAVLCVLAPPADKAPAREALAGYGAVFEVELSESSESDADSGPDSVSGPDSESGTAP